MKAVDVSRGFVGEVLVPAVERKFPELTRRMACGMLGTGSDTVGLDDEFSQDHHWGVRANIVLSDEDHRAHGRKLLNYLKKEMPPQHQGLQINFPKLMRDGVTVESIGHYFLCFAKMKKPPVDEMQWFKTTESDLFHLSTGQVFHDPAGEFTRRREAFAYYPDNIWKKRIADWCLYFAGSQSPYNVHRCARRGDHVAATMFFALAVRRALELGFLLNRRYAPYIKWLPRLFRTLPRLANRVDPLIQEMTASQDWDRRVHLLVDVAHIYAHELHALGLTGPPRILPFHPSLTDLTLYYSAVELYDQVPKKMFHAHFSDHHHWDVIARDVICDPDSFVQKRQ